MSLSLEDLDHVSTLAHLDLTEDERHRYLHQLQTILDNMNVLNRISLDQDLALPLTETPQRADICLPHQNLLISENAPEWHAPYFGVPKMLD